MKITIDIPDSALVMTCQFVYDDPDVGLAITQKTFDTNTLAKMRLEKMLEEDEEDG